MKIIPRYPTWLLTWGALMLCGITSVSAQTTSGNWLDNERESAQHSLQNAADKMNHWFGTPKPDQPASAQLRVIFDNHWNRYDGVSIKPRLRGKIVLPTLKERLNIVFGDDSIDDEITETATATTSNPLPQDKKLDLRQARRENATVGLQWVVPNESQDIKTRFSLGLRSGGDLYAKIRSTKYWYYSDNLRTRGELMYRYGIKSEHLIRGDWEVNYAENHVINSNHLRLDYYNDDDGDGWSWGDTVSRKHPTGDDTWYHYGFYLGGDIDNGGKASINTYGPFVGLRSQLYRDWLYIQPELTFYNDKSEDRDHHIGVMIRFEAQF